MLARIQRGQAADLSSAPRSTRRRTAAVAGMAATVATVLGLSVAATWAAVRDETPQEPVPAASVTVSPTPTAASSPSATPAASTTAGSVPDRGATGRPSSAAQPPRSPGASPGRASVQQDFLWSSGAVDPHSIDNWAQSNVTLRNSEAVSALQLRVRIARTPDVTSTGAWSTVGADKLVISVEQQPDALVYTFTLKPGVRLVPADHMFAVQYGHATGGRDPSRDSYEASATALDGTRAEVNGGF
ncbi:hypothetical protein [Micromonospora sp. KC213]|uniref:hypothetical protein n=1 Tax=Micromonospora sp. KC213 TaxID=2530378 RepID=UPI001053E801|nr:hypothetical protein [Micromonospora sp. KC213]TDC43988.1 hypothetical protein E1166_01840 [Micromonospora sp. KC213]